jgi:hypothetical protein
LEQNGPSFSWFSLNRGLVDRFVTGIILPEIDR